MKLREILPIIYLISASFLASANTVQNNHVDCDVSIPNLDCDGDGTPNGEDEAPLNPCLGGTKVLDSNDCDGDGLSVGDGDPDDQDYCNPIDYPECSSNTPPETPGQITLTNTCEDSTKCFVIIQAKVFLQGAYDEDNPELLRDVLREKQLIPLSEPYEHLEIYEGEESHFKLVGSGNETTTQDVLNIVGPNAIVDWIFLELHDYNQPSRVVATKSALLQRDGDIVDTDGVSLVKINIAPSNYYLAIRHRNHLGVMTKHSVPFFQETSNLIDFTSSETPLYELNDIRKSSLFAQRQIEGRHYLWGGNSNADRSTIYQGPDLDQTKVFFDVFMHPDNIGADGFPNNNFIVRGYSISDINMDGEIRYQGPDNDIDDFQFFNVILHPENPFFYTNKIIYEQIPTE